MKQYLAMFMGSPAAFDTWMKLPEAERKEKERAGMEGWMKWATDNKGAIVNMGSPLGKTKRIDKSGVSDIRNEMGAWCVVQASSYDEAAKLFLNHPHFTMFPGERVEIMECLPIPAR